MAEDRTKAILRTLDNMPPLMPSVSKVFEIANNVESTVSDMDRVISMDPVLSTRVLKLVNSSYYGLREKISTTQRAIVHLGMNTIKNLVLTVAVMKSLTESLRGSDISVEDFWKHALGVSVACRIISRRANLGPHAVEDCALAGLLHDIGKLGLINYSSKEYIKVVEMTKNNNITSLAAERQIIVPDSRISIAADGSADAQVQMKSVLIDHCYIGRELAKKWNFPEALIDPIAHHHLPWECTTEHAKVCYIVYVADTYSKTNGMGFAYEEFVPKFHASTWLALGFPEEDLKGIDNEWHKGVDEAQDFIAATQ